MSSRGPWRGAPPSPGLAMLAELMTDHLDPGYAAAARAREQDGPLPTRRARLRSLARIVALVVIGAILATAFLQTLDHAPDTAKANAGLVDDVKDRSAQTDQLQVKAERLREQVARQREEALTSTEAGSKTAADLRDLEASVGVGPVSGPGIVVTAGDGPQPKDPVTGELTAVGDPARLLDRDLQELVNALWETGGEAIAIDGQRLTPTSTIRLAGEAILVDLRPVSSPYRIEVIGNPLTTDDAFSSSAVAERFRAYKARYGIVFSVGTANNIKLAAASAPILRYARAPESGGPVRSVPRSALPSVPGRSQPSGPVPAPRVSPSPGGGR